MLDMLLKEGKSIRETRNYFMDVWSNFDTMPMVEVGIPKSLSMKPESYVKPAQVKAVFYARYFMNRNYQPGSRLLKYYVKSLPPGLPTRFKLPNGRTYDADRIVLNPEEDDLEEWRQYVDWKTMKEKVLVKKISRMLEPMGYTVSEFLSGHRQQSLFDFEERERA